MSLVAMRLAQWSWLSEAILWVGRNSRWPKQANHGARPCSHIMRRLKKKEHYQRWKTKTPMDVEDWNK